MNPVATLDARVADKQPQLIALAIFLVIISMIGMLLDIPEAVIMKSLALLTLAPVIRVATRRAWRIYPPIEMALFCAIYWDRLRIAEPLSMVALVISMMAVLWVLAPPYKPRAA